MSKTKYRKPVKVSKNAIINIIRDQRKATKSRPFTWLVIGLKREGVEPTALIVDEHHIDVFYEKGEYDTIIKVEDYNEFAKKIQKTRQDDVAEFIDYQAKKWEQVKRKEYKVNRGSPVHQTLHPQAVILQKFHLKDGEIMFEEEVFYDENTFYASDIIKLLETYKPLVIEEDTVQRPVTIYEDEFVISIGYIEEVEPNAKYVSVLTVKAPVEPKDVSIAYELKLDKVDFKWELPSGKNGISHEDVYRDPFITELKELKDKHTK